jgi:antitoxin YefM
MLACGALDWCGPLHVRLARVLHGESSMTRILVMEAFSLSYVKAHLSEITDRVEGEHERVVVTRKGRPAAVLVSPEDLASLEETLAVLSDPDLMGRIGEGKAAVESGDTLGLEELQARLGRRAEQA